MGHDINLQLVPPVDNYKLNWLLSAGNINVSLKDYIKFIQLQLKGLNGQTKILSLKTFNKLIFGLPGYSFGWFNKLDTAANHRIAFNEGNAGAFITQVQIIEETNTAFIIFTNSASTDANKGMEVLFEKLKSKYDR